MRCFLITVRICGGVEPLAFLQAGQAVLISKKSDYKTIAGLERYENTYSLAQTA